MSSAILEATLTCPRCGCIQTDTMPRDACQWFYECQRCHSVIIPKPGDCCIYCSYGSTPCPSIQQSVRNDARIR